MLFAVITLLVAVSVVQTQSATCIEDSQCLDNFFCEIPTYECRKCLDCLELNRSLPEKKTSDTCEKTDEDCGPCFKGWRPRPMYYGTKCETGQPKRTQFLTKEVYIWCTVAGAAAGILIITIIFLRVFQTTSIFKVVYCYMPIPLNGIKWPGSAKNLWSVDNSKITIEEGNRLCRDSITV